LSAINRRDAWSYRQRYFPLSIRSKKMTGYTVHTGSSEKFSQGWDQIFQGQKKQPAKPAAKPAAEKKAPKGPKKK
jgi:hypothetical protein